MDYSITHYNTMDYGYIMDISWIPLAPAQQLQPHLGAQPQCGEDVWGRFQTSSHLKGSGFGGPRSGLVSGDGP